MLKPLLTASPHAACRTKASRLKCRREFGPQGLNDGNIAMKLPSLKQTALAALSLTLAGCAGSDLAKDATALVITNKTGDAKDAAAAAPDLRPAVAGKDGMPAIDLAGALRQAE